MRTILFRAHVRAVSSVWAHQNRAITSPRAERLRGIMNRSDLQELLEGAGDPAFVVNGAGVIIAWNAAAKELFGLSDAEVLGKECWAIVDGFDSRGARVCMRDCAVLEIARRHRRLSSFEVRVKTAGGKRKWVRVSVLVASARETQALVHIVHDVNAEKQLQAVTKEMVKLVHRLGAENIDAGLEPRAPEAPVPNLTARERTVLKYLGRGMSTADMADELNVSIATIRNHVQHLLEKLGVHTRLEAVSQARSRRML
jgi:PAS domain S-box-containing protein